MSDRGVYYVAAGARWYIDECLASAASVKRLHPNLPVALATDAADASFPNIDHVIRMRDSIHPLKQKVKYLPSSPFERTLFLDTDTVIRRPIGHLFERLDGADFVIAPAPAVDWQAEPPVFRDYELPGAFNTGVFLYRRSRAVAEFLREWYTVFRDQEESVMRPGSFCDQYYFNQIFEAATQRCGLRWETMSSRIYNARAFLERILEEDGVLAEVAIFHGRASQHRLARQAPPIEIEFP